MEVFVTGIGAVSAFGMNVSECLNSLSSKKSGITQNENGIFTGSIKVQNSELKEILAIPRDKQIPRTALLGIMAAKEAFTKPNKQLREGFINGMTTGGMDLTEQYYRTRISDQEGPDFHVISTHDLGTNTELIREYLGIEGYFNTISTACSSSANSIMLGARLIKNNKLDRVLVGGCDALSEFTINGFRSLMIYDTKICRPFDENRKGLNLGEGAGFVLLENEKSIKTLNSDILAKLSGWSNNNDAFHQTGTSPDGLGASLSMAGALKNADLKAEDIDYLNAHGTATRNNDESEIAAIQDVFETIDFSSTKGFSGHTLGAAGGLEAVISILSIMNQCAFPNLKFEKEMTSASAAPLLEYTAKKIKYVMSNSFGFGGNSTSLIFSKA